MNTQERQIGTIGNYYGDLRIQKEGEKYYWSIENYSGHNWEEISEELFSALNKFQDQKEQQ